VKEWEKQKGLIIFIGLLVLVTVVALAAYRITGDMGIEERFTHALGIESGGEAVKDGRGSGLALEGSAWLYAGVLGVLVVVCYAVYRHFGV
jgi:hypothetical protein